MKEELERNYSQRGMVDETKEASLTSTPNEQSNGEKIEILKAPEIPQFLARFLPLFLSS